LIQSVNCLQFADGGLLSLERVMTTGEETMQILSVIASRRAWTMTNALG